MFSPVMITVIASISTEVLRREPFGGPVMIRVGDPKEGRVHGFGVELANVLSVAVAREPAA